MKASDSLHHDGSWESENFKAVECPDWGDFINIIWQWCTKWSQRKMARLVAKRPCRKLLQ